MVVVVSASPRFGKISDVARDSAAAVAVQVLILMQSKRRQATSLP